MGSALLLRVRVPAAARPLLSPLRGSGEPSKGGAPMSCGTLVCVREEIVNIMEKSIRYILLEEWREREVGPSRERWLAGNPLSYFRRIVYSFAMQVCPYGRFAHISGKGKKIKL